MMKNIAFATTLFFAFTAFGADALPLEDVIERVNPAVVNVVSKLQNGEQALGTGIVTDSDGYIVTNAHVTENFESIYVLSADGTQYEAEFVGDDDKTDIALLKIETSEAIEPAQFADSDSVRVGNAVFAIGNPFGLGNSVSLGIISAKERDIEKGPYDNFLQTDATINQGNSGGPLFDMNGKIVGMNTAIFSLDGQYVGIGFATPSNTVKWVAEQIKEKGRVVRGWLGFGVQKIKEKSENGGYVLAVDYLKENSPAANSGLVVGDIIEAFGEIELSNPRTFSLEISKLEKGTKIPAIIRRDEKKIDLVFEIGVMPDDKSLRATDEELGLESKETAEKRMKSFAELGIDAKQVVNAHDFAQIGIKAYFEEKNREFVVVAVLPNSEAEKKEVKIGDRIISVNEQKPFGVDDFAAKLKKSEQTGNVSLTLLSGTSVYTISLKVGK